MANIFSLFGEIFIDNSKANKNIEDTTKKGKESSKSFTESLGGIVQGATKIGTALVGASTAVATGLSAMAINVADSAGAIDDGAKKVGTSAEEYQKWAYAAKLGGMETSKLEALMIKQQKAFSDAKEGSKSLTTAYKNLGVNINEIGSSGDAFNAVIDALADMEDETTRNALANDIFGKSYADLAPLLAEGSEGIKAWKQEAEDLGGVLSSESVEVGANFGDTVDRLKTGFSGMYNKLVANFLPVLDKILNMVLDNMPQISNIISSLSPILTSFLETLLPPLMNLCESILPIIVNLINILLPTITNIVNSILPVIIQLIEMFLPPVLQIVELILPMLISLIEPLMPLLEPIFNLLQPFIDLLIMLLEPLMELLDMILPPLIELFTKIMNYILPALQMGLTMAANIISGVFGGAFETIKKLAGSVINVFKNIIDFIKNVFTGNWKNAWENIKNIFKNIAEGLGNIFKYPINFIIDLINGFIGGLNKIKIPDWVPGVGGLGVNLPLIKRLRVGIDYVPYDEMPALLHKGERVLTEEENKKYNEKTIVQGTDYNKFILAMKQAFVEALLELKGVVNFDEEKMGDFIITKVEKEVFG